MRAAASHTAALAGSYAAYRAMFQRYGLIEGRDIGEMVDIAAGFVAWGSRLPQGERVGICTASGGGGGWMADACAAAGLEVPAARCGDARAHRRAPAGLRHVAEPRRRHRAGHVQDRLCRAGRAGGALAGGRRHRRGDDGAQSPANLERQREALGAPGGGDRASRSCCGATRCRRQRSVQDPERGRLSALHRHPATARAPCAPWPTTGRCASASCGPSRCDRRLRRRQGGGARRRSAAAGPVLCEWEARPVARRLRHRQRTPAARWRNRRTKPLPPRGDRRRRWR